jgi:hypothetical protein
MERLRENPIIVFEDLYQVDSTNSFQTILMIFWRVLALVTKTLARTLPFSAKKLGGKLLDEPTLKWI